MLIDHRARREHDEHTGTDEGDGAREQREHDAQMRLPVLDEPAWLADDLDEEMDAPPDSALRGMWVGIAAAAVTFVLVFAIPQWLGWYDVPAPSAKREATPEAVVSTVTAQPSGAAVVETGPPAASAAAAPPATAPPVSRPGVTPAKESKPAPPAAVAPAPSGPSRRTFSVQIAAFKSAKPARELAARVKREGFAADTRRVGSSAVPWVVRVGGYPTREAAESARDALARKGFRGFIL
jgi:cell division septation protein DedD